ncbi:hypothetical protein BsWGS_12824 [Bradybaena similaris]
MDRSEKNWLKSATASLARLNQIQASSHAQRAKGVNMYKPPSSTHVPPQHYQSELFHQSKYLGTGQMSSHYVNEEVKNSETSELSCPTSASVFLTLGSKNANSKLIGNQKKQRMTRPSSAKVHNKVMPGSPSNENQLSAVRTRHLSGSKLSAEALNINFTTGKTNIHSKRTSPDSWGNNPCYLARGERIFSHDKKNTSLSFNTASNCSVTDQSRAPQLGDSEVHCHFAASSDTEGNRSIYTPSELLLQPTHMPSINVRLPNTYGESEDGDDELDNDSVSLDGDADEDIIKNVMKDGYGVMKLQTARSVLSDSSQEFNTSRKTSNLYCQRNMLSRHYTKVPSHVSDIKDTKNKNQNKTRRLNTKGILNHVDSSDLAPKYISAPGKVLHDSETSIDASESYLGQVEAATPRSIMKVPESAGSGLQRESISEDNCSEASTLLPAHNAEPSDIKNTGQNGKLFLLSEKVFKTESKLGDSAPEIRHDCFLASSDVNVQSGSVEAGTEIAPCAFEGTDHAVVDLAEELNYTRNLTDSKSNILSRSRIKIKDNRAATAETIVRNTHRKLQKKNVDSNNTSAQAQLMHGELESDYEHGDLSCESVVSSSKKYGSQTLNKESEHSIKATSQTKQNYRPVPVVTIDYENDESIKELKPNGLRNNMEPTLEPAEQNVDLCSLLTVCKSSKEKNYYDVACRLTSGTVMRECVNIPEENSEQWDKHKFVKTAGIIEFTPEAPQDIIAKSIRQPTNQPQPLPVDDLTCKPLLEYEPVRITKAHSRILSAPKERRELFLNRSKAKSAPDLFRARQMVWTQDQTSKPTKENRNITAKGKSSSSAVMFSDVIQSRDVRIASAPSRRLRQNHVIRDSVAEEIRGIQSKIASLGANNGIKALEKALYTTSGRMVHTHTASYLPSDPSYGLIPHYKHWLPEEYKILKTIDKKLGQDEHFRRLRSLRIAKKMKKLTVGDVEKLTRKA